VQTRSQATEQVKVSERCVVMANASSSARTAAIDVHRCADTRVATRETRPSWTGTRGSGERSRHGALAAATESAQDLNRRRLLAPLDLGASHDTAGLVLLELLLSETPGLVGMSPAAWKPYGTLASLMFILKRTQRRREKVSVDFESVALGLAISWHTVISVLALVCEQ